MKRLFALLFACVMVTPFVLADYNADTFWDRKPGLDKENCTFHDIPLYGDVQVVNSNADFKVKIVNSAENFRVEKVNSNAISCGEWIFVGTDPDFTIQFVNSNPDFTIRYVNSQPGIFLW